MRAPPTRTIERANNRSHKIRKRNVGKKKKGNYAGRQMTRPIADGWWRLQDKSSVNRFLIDSRVRRSWVLKRRLLRFTSLYPDWSPMRTVTYFYLLVPGLDEFISNLMCVCVCVCVCVCIYVIHGRSSWLPFHYPRGIYRSDDEWQIQCCDTIAGVSSPVLFGFFTVDVRSDGPNVWQTRNFAAARHVRLQISSQSVHKRLKQYIWWDMKSGGRWSY